MQTIRFGRSALEVPTISLGTWGHGGPRTSEGRSVGWGGHDDQLAKKAMVAAHRAGITHWDTADAYGDGHAEELIGEVLASVVPRADLVIASKVGYVKGPAGHVYDPAFMRKQCEKSLRNMGIAAMDIYYFHHCDFGPDDVYFDGALETMQRLRDEGKTRFLGLSDWSAARIMKYIARVDPDVVQPYRNLLDDDYDASGLAQWVASHDLGVAFFSPLKHGLLLGKYSGTQTFEEGDFRSGIPEFRDAAAIAHLQRAAAAVRTRFGDRDEPVLSAVTGALLTGNPTATVLLGQRNEAQVSAAARAGAALSDKDAAWIRRLYREM